MLLIYTEQITHRLSYTFDLMLARLLGLSYEVTTDKEKFSTSPLAKISYASQPLSDEVFFEKTALLFETSIHEIKESCIRQRLSDRELVGYFKTEKNSALSFDIFASAFLLVSRYEEYLPSKKDKHDRYEALQSMAVRDGFIDHPMVNYYAVAIERKLRKKYPVLVFKESKFEYISTIDIDMAYSFLYKGFKRNIGGFLKDIWNLNFVQVKQRMNVLSGKKRDPFDTFGYIEKIHQKYHFAHQFFILLGDYGEFDKNTSYLNSAFRKLIQKIESQYKTGIHFSYGSHSKPDGYRIEKERLEEIIQQPVSQNRFHFLKFTLPDTYQKIAAAGITEDYSMGHASMPGFRASIVSPFLLFDVKANEVTKMTIYPFVYMDGTFQFYQKKSPTEAKEKIAELMQRTQSVGGNFISIWHNNSLCNQGEWQGWRDVYEYTHELAQSFSSKKSDV